MKKILVLSPHLDDAAFSLGPYLAETSKKNKITVATVFTKTVKDLSDFAMACQLDKGLSCDVDYMNIRRKEDVEWSERIGVEIIHGLLPEAPHRGYNSAKELFGLITESLDFKYALKDWFFDLLQKTEPDVIFCPLGVGNHVDHVLVRQMVLDQGLNRILLFLYKDLPYAEHISFKLSDYILKDDNWIETSVSLSIESLEQAIYAAEAYKTQIKFQFGSKINMISTLKRAWSKELILFKEKDLNHFDDNLFTRMMDRSCLD